MITMGVRLSEHPERMIIMSMRGGYQIIDLKNVPLYSGFVKDNVENHIYVKGIYYNLYHSNAKMILLSGLNVDNKPHRDYEIIPYEEDNEFKAILKKVWNTDKHLVYTYFLHIAENDDVYITYEELDYDRVDKEFNDDSDIAIANSTVSKKVKALDAEDLTFLKLDGSRPMTGSLNMNYQQLKAAVLSLSELGSNLGGGNYEITNLAAPTGAKSAARKIDVDAVHTLVNNYKISDSVTLSESGTMNTISAIIRPGIVEITVNVAQSAKNISNTTTFIEESTYNKYKSLYDSMGISYDKIIEAKSGFIAKDGSSTGSQVAFATATCQIQLTANSKTVGVTLVASATSGEQTLGSIFNYSTVALFEVKS